MMRKDERRPFGKFRYFISFAPIIILVFSVLIFQLDLLLAAPIAFFSAVAAYLLLYGGTFANAIDYGLEAAKKIVLILFVLMFAGGLSECFMSAGVGAALIRLILYFGVTGRTAASISLIVAALFSLAIGSAWGTFAACAPICLWMTHLVGGNVYLSVCAVAGGACFGNNLSLISDCTVLSCSLFRVGIVEKTKHQLAWSLLSFSLALITFYLASLGLSADSLTLSNVLSAIPEDSLQMLSEQSPAAVSLLKQVQDGVPFYLLLPIVATAVPALFGRHTLICLGCGMVSSLLFGLLAGTLDLSTWFYEAVYSGFANAGKWPIVMMLWIAAFGGLICAMDTFTPLAELLRRRTNTPRQLLGWCGIMCFICSLALADEAAEIVTMSPIMDDLTEKTIVCGKEQRNTIRLRLATLASSIGLFGSELIVWHSFPVFFAGIAESAYPLCAFTPFDIVRHNYLSMIAVILLLLFTFTPLDCFLPGFSLPRDMGFDSKET